MLDLGNQHGNVDIALVRELKPNKLHEYTVCRVRQLCRYWVGVCNSNSRVGSGLLISSAVTAKVCADSIPFKG